MLAAPLPVGETGGEAVKGSWKESVSGPLTAGGGKAPLSLVLPARSRANLIKHCTSDTTP